MQHSSIKPNNPDISAKYKILKNRKFRKVPFNPVKVFADAAKAATLNKNHFNI